jgi:signal transduction histidine kinase
MSPLDRLGSIKLRIGLIIVAAIAVSALVSTVGYRFGIPLLLRPVMAAVIALAMVQVLARGLTSPLREMAAAARAMAAGDHGRQVEVRTHDEVGELARAFNAMSAELAEVDRVRRDLVANVSHELRTPISALQAVLENIVDGVAQPDPETLRTMLGQVERLGRLVAQLLDLSRLESGAVPLERQSFAVRPVLDDVAALSRLHSPGIAVQVDVDGPSPVIDGDPERIHQVVANLVENAVRFSPARGTVAVRTRSDGGIVTIEVDDDGPGIAPDQEVRVFERFYRADTSRASADGGAGLGLAIARWVVDLHGGDISAQARDPRGCRMVVTLPAATG